MRTKQTRNGKKLRQVNADMRSAADRLGSYTGNPTEGDIYEKPTQDADDL